jgi:hypothetical protein
MKKLSLALLSFLFCFCACSGRPYTFDIDTADIEEIYIDLSGGYKVNIEQDSYQNFMADLNNLHYKSYAAEVLGETAEKINIRLKDDTLYKISAYRIIIKGKNQPYLCEESEYMNLLEKYTTEPVYYNFTFTAEDIDKIEILQKGNSDYVQNLPENLFAQFYEDLSSISYTFYYGKTKDYNYYFKITLKTGDYILISDVFTDMRFECQRTEFENLVNQYLTE